MQSCSSGFASPPVERPRHGEGIQSLRRSDWHCSSVAILVASHGLLSSWSSASSISVSSQTRSTILAEVFIRFSTPHNSCWQDRVSVRRRSRIEFQLEEYVGDLAERWSECNRLRTFAEPRAARVLARTSFTATESCRVRQAESRHNVRAALDTEAVHHLINVSCMTIA